jgi:ferredoxin
LKLLLAGFEKLQFFEAPISRLRSLIMAYKISDACINCGACEGECPVNAISEKNDVRVIDANTCISCGACSAVCPVEAISEE